MNQYVKENQWIVEILSVCANKTIKRVALQNKMFKLQLMSWKTLSAPPNDE